MKKLLGLASIILFAGCAWFQSHKAALEQLVADEVVCVAQVLASGGSATSAAVLCGVKDAADIEKILLAQDKVSKMGLGAPKCAAPSASVKP